jgi:hypothetical protein
MPPHLLRWGNAIDHRRKTWGFSTLAADKGKVLSGPWRARRIVVGRERLKHAAKRPWRAERWIVDRGERQGRQLRYPTTSVASNAGTTGCGRYARLVTIVEI